MNVRLCMKNKKPQISTPIETVNKIQIGNVDAYEIVRFKEDEELSEDHSLKYIKLFENQIPDENIFQNIFQDFPKPKIIILINGELDNVNYPPKKYEKEFKEIFSKFLIADTQWVIGTGAKIGVHGLISDAVQDCRFENIEKHINMIGMLDHALVQDVSSVIKSKSNKNNNFEPPNFYLDPHYNCIIFHHITNLNPIQKIKKAIEIQMKFQEYCKKYEPFTIQILCGGGLYELELAMECLRRNIFILVLQGSGGIAEVICKLKDTSNSSDEKSIIENVKHKYLEDLEEKEMNDYIKKLIEIPQFNNHILIYDITNEKERIDKKLFEAIIKSMDGDLEKILLLSMSFSENFISKREIFQKSDFNELDDKQRKTIFIAILKNNKPILFELFLNKDVSIDKFLNVTDLKDLYQESIKAKIGCKILLDEQFSLIDKNANFERSKDCKDSHNQGIKHTFGRERLKTNSDIEGNVTKDAKRKKHTFGRERLKTNSDIEGNVTKDAKKSQQIVMENLTCDEKHKNPVKCQDIFIWALLSGLHEIAKIIWRVGNDHVATALKGSIILDEMSKCVIDLSQLSKNYSKESELYRNMAINIMTEAFDKNQLQAYYILLRPLKRWNNMSCLQIAVNGNVKEFCNQNACIAYTKHAWHGIHSLQSSRKKRIQNNNDEKQHFRNMLGEKINKWYQSPNIKFINYIILYLIFLLFFIHVNLVELKPFARYHSKINMWSEMYVYCYVAGFIGEEINQIINQEPNDNKSRFRIYINGSWNIYDCLLIILFTISVILRFTLPDTNFNIIRCFYALALSMFIIRSMQFFFISRALGPKVIMIKKMLIDILFFLLIFLIFMLSYGTLSQSLKNPNSPLQFSLIKDVLYRPYFHVYGELMLDDYKAQCNSTNCWLVEETRIIAFGLFLLLTTILLVNLLVAMFGHTFTLIQKHVESHFSILQLQLLQEFYNKSFLPPPINIVTYILMIFFKTINRNKNKKKSSQIILVDNSLCDTVRLAAFEESFVKSTLQKFNTKQILN